MCLDYGASKTIREWGMIDKATNANHIHSIEEQVNQRLRFISQETLTENKIIGQNGNKEIKEADCLNGPNYYLYISFGLFYIVRTFHSFYL